MSLFRFPAIVFLLSTLQVEAPAQANRLAESYYHFSLAKLHEFNQEFLEAISEYEKALAISAEEDWVRLEYARALWSAGQAQRAMEECRAVIGRDSESVEAHFLLAQIYAGFRSQDEMREQAVAEFRRVLEIDPKHFESLYYLGQLHLSQEDFPEAVEIFSRFIQLRPDLIEGYFRKGFALSEMDRREQAIETLEKGLQASEEVSDTYWELLAGLYQRTGSNQKALQAYRRGLENGSSPALKRKLAQLLMKEGKAGEAVPLYREVASVFPQEQRLQTELGQALRENRQFAEAADVLAKVVDERPLDLEANFELALALEGMGERQQAIEKLKYLLKIADSRRFDAALKTRLALLYQDSRQFEAAIELFREVSRENRDDFYTQLRLFYALMDASRHKEAEQLSLELLKKFPGEPRAFVARAQVLARLNQPDRGVRLLSERLRDSQDAELFYLAISQIFLEKERRKEAEITLQKALSQYPDSRQLRFQLGAVYEQQKKYESAENEFHIILKDDPENAPVLNYLGYMLADMGIRLTEALVYVEKAVKLDPYNGAYLDSLGWVYYKLGDFEKAEVYLKKAFQINPFDSTIAEHLGDLYKKQGRSESARRFYETSISLAEKESEHERVEQKLSQLNQGIRKD